MDPNSVICFLLGQPDDGHETAEPGRAGRAAAGRLHLRHQEVQQLQYRALQAAARNIQIKPLRWAGDRS